MWIIYKYTIKSILEKKLRTSLIILAVSLAGALFIVSSELSEHIAQIYEYQYKQQLGNVEISILPDEHSTSSVINDHLCQEIAGISQSIGVFWGSGQYKVRNNLYDVWNLAGYELEDYREVNTLVLAESKMEGTFSGKQMIISQKTADKYQLKLGEQVELKIEGIKRRWQIVGIAEAEGIFANEGSGLYCIVPLETLSRYYNANGKPNALYLKGATNAESMKEMICEAQSVYPKYKVEETFDSEKFKEQMSWITQPFMLMTGIVIFISAFIIFSTFKVIVLEKLPIVGTFRSIGASKKMMTGVLLLESLCYGIVGGALGLVMGNVLIKIIVQGLVRTSSGNSNAVRISTMLGGYGLAIGVAIVSTLIPILSVSKISLKDIVLGNEKKKVKGDLKGFVLGIILITVGVKIAGVEDVSYKLMGAIGGLILVTVGIILILPLIVNKLAIGLSYTISVIFGNVGRLAAKNLKSNKSALNSMTLITLGISVMLVISTVSESLMSQVVQAYENVYRCDIEVELNEMDDTKLKALRNVEGVSSVSKSMYKSEVECEETESVSLGIMAIEELDFYKYLDFHLQNEGNALLATLQEGRNVIISKILARKYNLQVGETLHFELEGQRRSYKVIGIMDNIWNNGFLCLIPMKYYKQDTKESYYATAYVSIKKNEKNTQVADNIKEKFKEEHVSAKTVVEMCQANTDSNASLMKMISLFGVLTLVIGMIGVVNNLVISFIERRKNLAVLRSIGMSQRQMFKMIFVEAIGSGIIGGIGGMLAGYLFLLVLNDILFALNLPITVECIPRLFIVYFMGGSIVTVIGSTLPARSIPKMNIIEAIKFE